MCTGLQLLFFTNGTTARFGKTQKYHYCNVHFVSKKGNEYNKHLKSPSFTSVPCNDPWPNHSLAACVWTENSTTKKHPDKAVGGKDLNLLQ